MAGTATPSEGVTALHHLTQWLDGAGVPWRAVRHRPTWSAAAEARALARPAEMVAKAVVLDVGGTPATVVIPASERLSLTKLRSVLGSGEVTLAREDDIVRLAPAYELGALPPCGPGVPAVAVVDRRLLTYGQVLCAAGDQSTSLAVDPMDLVRVTGAVEADVHRGDVVSDRLDAQAQAHAALQTHGLRAVTEYLDGEQVSYDVIEHPATETAAAEAREAHVPGDRMAKTLVVHAEGAALLAVVPASCRLDLEKLRSALHSADALRLATEREIGELFPQFDVGAVPPVGPMLVGTTVVDNRLLAHADVLCAGGDHEHSIRISAPDLVRLADAHVADICQDWATGEERVRF